MSMHATAFLVKLTFIFVQLCTLSIYQHTKPTKHPFCQLDLPGPAGHRRKPIRGELSQNHILVDRSNPGMVGGRTSLNRLGARR